METKLTRWCDGVIEAGVLAALILTPLFFNIHSDRVFEPDKLTLLRSLALVMAAAWLVRFLDQKGWRELRRLGVRSKESIWNLPFMLPTLLIVVVYLLSNLFSVTPSVSWAGSYQRLQGTYSTLSYIVVFGVAVSTVTTRAQARRIVTMIIITSIPIAFYGLLQHFDLDPLPWAGDTTARVAGHMGNAIFIAAYLIMAVPLTLSRIIASFSNILNDAELSTADVIRASVYIFTLAIQLITIYWSGSRGPWLGLFVGLFAFVLIVLVALRNAESTQGRFLGQDAAKGALLVAAGTAVPYLLVLLLLNAITGSGRAAALVGPMTSFVAFVVAVGLVVVVIFVMIAAGRGWRWLWFSWILLAALLSGWLVLFNLPADVTEPYRETPVVGGVVTTLDEWRELPRIGRLGQVLEADQGTGRVRTLIWEGVLDLITPHEPLRFPDGQEDVFNWLRPFLGYGPESMYVAYNRFYPPELATIEARNASPDRSHNETFDALVITGWLGLLAWQFLYITVFYYSFRWLGVLRTKLDRWLLIGLWIGGGVVTAVAFAAWRGPVYVGVAFPFGSIAGLILYLIYYALFAARQQEGESGVISSDPFAADRLMMVALAAALLAHYVEIHFGIAIASTRTHFFLYVALIFMLGYRLPRRAEPPASVKETAAAAGKRRRRNRRRAATAPARTSSSGGSLWGPIWLNTTMLALIVGTLGFQFTNYAQPPGQEISSIQDLPVSAIVRQSLFVDGGKNFADSPFVFLMIVLTWGLGTLLIVSEMVKDGALSFQDVAAKLAANKRMAAASTFLVIGIAGVGFRFLLPPPLDAGAAYMLGRSLALGGGLLSLVAAVFLFLQREGAPLVGGIVALFGAVISLPIMFAGGVGVGLATAVLSIGLLALLWQRQWSEMLLPVALLAAGSLLIGFVYTYLHAFLLRNSLFFQPTTQIETMAQLTEFRVAEARQSTIFITMFYLFTFALVLLGGWLASMHLSGRVREWGSTPAYGALVALLIAVPVLITVTNLRVVQADMVYKRGRFYDNQAGGSGDADVWDTAIAVYEEAIRMAPREDYYYLFLGRAYLERSTVTEDPIERAALLAEAEARLLEAQRINPLNTDHTANLARLNTRRVALTDAAAERQSRVQTAEQFYQDALALSPQNSVIRNEYARLAYDLQQSCERAIEIFEESIAIDPFYEESYFQLAEVYARCATTAEESEQRADYTNLAVETIEAGVALAPQNGRSWLRAAQLYESLGAYEQAADAYDTLLTVDPEGRVQPIWRIVYQQAVLAQQAGDNARAQELAQRALTLAPAEVAPQIELFLNQFAAGETLVENLAMAGVQPGERPLAALPPAQRNGAFVDYPPIVISTEKTYEATIVTEKGEMRFRLFPQAAPLAVNSFVFLASQGFYDGTTFHRVLEDFMAQGGDPTGTGSGGPGYFYPIEVDNGLSFDRRGLLALANAGPETNGSQFFITFAPTPGLTGQYTIFGELLAGDGVLDALTRRDPEANPDFSGDVIERIEITES